jgi:hypothetical protein
MGYFHTPTVMNMTSQDFNQRAPQGGGSPTDGAIASTSNRKVSGIKYSRKWPDPKWIVPRKEVLKGQVGSIPIVSDFLEMRDNLSSISEAVSGIQDFLNQLKSAIQFNATDDLTEAIMSRIESLLLLVVDLFTRKSLAEMFIPIVQYIKTWLGGRSVCKMFISWVQDIVFSSDEDDASEEWEDVPPGLNGQVGWFESNWMQLTKGVFGKKLASLLNLMILAGFMPDKSADSLTSELFKVLNVTSQRKKYPSIFHHLFSTIDWVIDSVVPAITTNNMSLLLVEEDVQEVDRIYRMCLEVVHLNITGQMALAKAKYGVIDEASILMMIVNTSVAIETMKRKCVGEDLAVKEYQARLIKLDKLSVDLQAHWHDASLRVKPYAVLIRGGSSVGKSTLGTIVSHVISRANKFPEGKEYWCTINGSDKYQSDFRSQHTCVMFDDMGNTKPEKCENNPLFVLIQFINNMHCSALSPEADKKGKMDIRCRIVIVTTNTSHLHAPLFSVNPASIMRRFDLVVDVMLKPDAVGPGGGLSPKFAGNPMPDAWDLSCGTVQIARSPSNHLADSWGIAILPDVKDVVSLTEYLCEVTPKYFAVQEEIVSASSEMHKKSHCVEHPMFCIPCAACAKGLEPAASIREQCWEATIPEECERHPGLTLPCKFCEKETIGKSCLAPWLTPCPDSDEKEAFCDAPETIVVEDVSDEELEHQGGIFGSDPKRVKKSVPVSAHGWLNHYESGTTEFTFERADIDGVPVTDVTAQEIPKSAIDQLHMYVTGLLYPPISNEEHRRRGECPHPGANPEGFDQFHETRPEGVDGEFRYGGPYPECEADYLSGRVERPWNFYMVWFDHLVEKVDPVWEFIFKKKSKLREKLSPMQKSILTMTAIGLAMSAGVHFIKRMMAAPLDKQGAVYSRILAAAQTPRQMVDRDNRYRKVYTNVARYPDASLGTTLSQLEAKIDRNLHMVTIRKFDEVASECFGPTEWCNSFPIGGTEWIVVGHMFDDCQCYKVEFQSHPSVGIKRFQAIVNRANMRPVFDFDAMVLDIPNGGDVTNFSPYMVERADCAELKPGTPIAVYHVHHSVMESEEVYVPPSSYKLTTTISEVKDLKVNGIGSYPGFTYKAETHQGMCGSMVFTTGRNPVLIGMHTAGDIKNGIGAAMLMCRQKVYESKVMREEYITVAESTPLRDEIYGVNVKTQPEAHEKNPIHFIEEDVNLEVIGQTSLPRARFKSEIVTSCIAEKLKEVSGIEDTHTNPQKKAATPSRHRHISTCGAVLPPANPWLVKMALEDFKAKLGESVFADGSQFKEFVHVLNYEDALNGVQGVRGFDPVNPKTSMSFPLTGAKYKYFVENALKEEMGFITSKFVRRLEKEDGTVEYSYELEFDPEKADVRTEVDNILEWFYEGKRVNAVFRANLKDEPVSFEKVAKNKIRIFAGAPVALVIVTRMLTLPLVSAMSNFPAEFESAVGVDAAGKDWEYISEILTSKSGGVRCGDGDYSAFDMRLRPEIQKAAYEMLKWCLLKCGVDPELVRLIDGLATENLYPIFDEDGVLVKVFGSGPSGHGLTVIINGLGNGILIRYAYYSMHFVARQGKLYLGEIPLFHENVALITYGDDNNFDVSPDEPLFNMLTVAEELAKIGHIYTDATKHVSTAKFKTIDDMSFLKRNFHKHPTLGKRVGALDIESIHKSLLLTRKARRGMTESAAQICASNMAAALGEVFLHGPEMYEKYAKWFDQLVDVRDSEGHRVGDYYSPPSIEDLVARYENTTCCYREVQKFLKPPEDLIRQSGTLDSDDELRELLEDLDWENDYYLDHDESLSLMKDTFNMLYEDEPRVDERECEYEFVNVVSLKFRCWLVECQRELADLLQPDYRFRQEFYEELREYVGYFSACRTKRRRFISDLSELLSGIDGPMVLIGTTDVKAVKVLQRQRRISVELQVLPEIEERIWSFLHPPFEVAGCTERGYLMVTPNYMRGPVEVFYRTADRTRLHGV